MAKKAESTAVDPYELPENFVDIDEDQLWEEWRRQPKLVHGIAVESANAKHVYADRKAALDVVKADMDILIRRDPTAFGLEKITNEAIANLVAVSEDCKTATRKMHRAKHRVDILEAALSTLEHRKKALENMVDLWAMDYFAEPRTQRPVSREKLSDADKRSVRSRRKIKKGRGDK